MTPERRKKQQHAKYKIFASQFMKAFQVFAKENKVEPNVHNFDLVKAFYLQKQTAKTVNLEIKKQIKRNKANIKHHLGTRVRPGAVRYNKGFNLINGDCLYGQEPISDKTQVCEPELIIIQ